jgi:hypothetical protein
MTAMKTRIDIQFLTCSDTEHFIEFLSDTPDTAFQVNMDSNESTISWNLEGEFCKHLWIKWHGKVLNAWIARKVLFGSPMLLFWCAEYRSKEWWDSFPEGTLPNDERRSYRIQEGTSDIIAHWEFQVLQLTGSEKHLRLAELTINQ